MNDKFVRIYSQSLWTLLPYYVVLVIFAGFTYKHVVDAMVEIAWLYGAPLAIFFFIYAIILFHSAYKRFRYKVSLNIDLYWMLIKLLIATTPMFFFDNHLAKVIVAIGDLTK